MNHSEVHTWNQLHASSLLSDTQIQLNISVSQDNKKGKQIAYLSPKQIYSIQQRHTE